MKRIAWLTAICGSLYLFGEALAVPKSSAGDGYEDGNHQRTLLELGAWGDLAHVPVSNRSICLSHLGLLSTDIGI